MQHAKILCLGEISWDRRWMLDDLPQPGRDCHLLSEQEAPGGCALNTAVILAAQGVPVCLGGNAVGDDARGRAILQYTEKFGVEGGFPVSAGLATPFCQCLVSRSTGERQFILDHATIQQVSAEAITGLARRARAGEFAQIFLQPYLHEASRLFLRELGPDGEAWILSQDLPPESEFVPCIDAMQISLSEARSFKSDAAARIAAPYFRGRLKTVFITAGARGVAIVEAGRAPILAPGVAAENSVDTTGCGDAFRAGLMWGRALGFALPEAVALGQRAGAYKAGVAGSHFVTRLGRAFACEWA